MTVGVLALLTALTALGIGAALGLHETSKGGVR